MDARSALRWYWDFFRGAGCAAIGFVSLVLYLIGWAFIASGKAAEGTAFWEYRNVSPLWLLIGTLITLCVATAIKARKIELAAERVTRRLRHRRKLMVGLLHTLGEERTLLERTIQERDSANNAFREVQRTMDDVMHSMYFLATQIDGEQGTVTYGWVLYEYEAAIGSEGLTVEEVHGLIARRTGRFKVSCEPGDIQFVYRMLGLMLARKIIRTADGGRQTPQSIYMLDDLAVRVLYVIRASVARMQVNPLASEPPPLASGNS